MLTGHIVDGADHAGGAARVEQADATPRRRSSPTWRWKPRRAPPTQIQKREAELVDEFKKKGIGRHTVNRAELRRRGAQERHVELDCDLGQGGSTASSHQVWRIRWPPADVASHDERRVPDSQAQRAGRWHSSDDHHRHRRAAQGDGRRRAVPRHRRGGGPVAHHARGLGGAGDLLAARRHGVLPVLHPLRAQQLGLVDRGDRALPADRHGLRRRGDRRGQEQPHPGRSLLPLPAARGGARAVDRGRRAAHRLLRRDGGAHRADDAEDGQPQDDHRRPADEHALRRVPVRLRDDGAALGWVARVHWRRGYSVLERPELDRWTTAECQRVHAAC